MNGIEERTDAGRAPTKEMAGAEKSTTAGPTTTTSVKKKPEKQRTVQRRVSDGERPKRNLQRDFDKPCAMNIEEKEAHS